MSNGLLSENSRPEKILGQAGIPRNLPELNAEFHWVYVDSCQEHAAALFVAPKGDRVNGEDNASGTRQIQQQQQQQQARDRRAGPRTKADWQRKLDSAKADQQVSRNALSDAVEEGNVEAEAAIRDYLQQLDREIGEAEWFLGIRQSPPQGSSVIPCLALNF